jgi:hypothetical protein
MSRMPRRRPTGGRRRATSAGLGLACTACLIVLANAAPGSAQGAAARADNVQFVVGEAGVVRILYDLVADDRQPFVSVRLLVSQDGGKTYEARPSGSLSGDVGPSVAPGARKEIVWAWAQDVERIDVEQLRFRIVAATLTAMPRGSNWGVGATFVPDWRIPGGLERAIFFSPASYSFHGSEYRLSVVRGRPFGRDWGLSLIRKRVAAGSFLTRNHEFNGTVSQTTIEATRGLWLTGADAYVFLPVARLGSRQQIGVVLAGGLVGVSGETVQRRIEGPIFKTNPYSSFPPPSFVQEGPGFVLSDRGEAIVVPAGARAAVDAVRARELFRSGAWGDSVQLVARVEAAYAVTLGAGFKLRVSGGLNVPAVQAVSVEVVRLFGPRP